MALCTYVYGVHMLQFHVSAHTRHIPPCPMAYHSIVIVWSVHNMPTLDTNIFSIHTLTEVMCSQVAATPKETKNALHFGPYHHSNKSCVLSICLLLTHVCLSCDMCFSAYIDGTQSI